MPFGERCFNLAILRRNLHDFPYPRDGQCRQVELWRGHVSIRQRTASNGIKKNENETGTIFRVAFSMFDHFGTHASNAKMVRMKRALTQEARVVMSERDIRETFAADVLPDGRNMCPTNCVNATHERAVPVCVYPGRCLLTVPGTGSQRTSPTRGTSARTVIFLLLLIACDN